MLFVIEYELNWESLETVIARKLDWAEIQPDGFRFVGEYVWPDHDPPFRGLAIVEADHTQAINEFVLHYGPTIKTRIHAATDLTSALGQASAKVGETKRRPAKKGR